MRERLTPEGYEQTKEKLAGLQQRLTEFEERKDLSPLVLAQAKNSCRRMIRKYLEDMKLYEAAVRRESHVGTQR
jgi:hypothetical protein